MEIGESENSFFSHILYKIIFNMVIFLLIYLIRKHDHGFKNKIGEIWQKWHFFVIHTKEKNTILLKKLLFFLPSV